MTCKFTLLRVHVFQFLKLFRTDLFDVRCPDLFFFTNKLTLTKSHGKLGRISVFPILCRSIFNFAEKSSQQKIKLQFQSSTLPSMVPVYFHGGSFQIVLCFGYVQNFTVQRRVYIQYYCCDHLALMISNLLGYQIKMKVYGFFVS